MLRFFRPDDLVVNPHNPTMHPIKTASGYPLTMLLFVSLSVTAQTPPHEDIISLDRMFISQPLPVSRWIVSFNPYGLLEPPAAIGLV
jgi:hypothetical protein